MNFLDMYQELEEIYDAPYKSTGVTYAYKDNNGLLYHFYEDLPDLIHSLDIRSIYSTKNDRKENAAQFDWSRDDDFESGNSDGSSYVCMTNTLVGKNYMTTKRNRPFGLSFKRVDVEKYCENKYLIRSFDAFAAKGDYTSSVDSKGQRKLTYLANTEARDHNPFTVFSIGELEAGKYFICGGQDVKNRWPAQIFSDKTLYEQLKDWFVSIYSSSTSEDYQRRSVYHFKNGNIGQVRAWADPDKKTKPVDVAGNLNTNYAANVYSKGSKRDYSPSIIFDFKGRYATTFKEVIGIGPIEVYGDKKELLLGLEPGKGRSTQGMYKMPFILGLNVTNNTYSDTSYINPARRTPSTQYDIDGNATKIYSRRPDLVADEKLFKRLCKVFSEFEYRIYLDSGVDFRFPYDLVSTIVFPGLVKIGGTSEVVNITKLKELLESNVTPEVEEVVMVTGEVADDYKLTSYTKGLVTALIDLLTGPYKHVGVEIVPNTTGDYDGLIPSTRTKLGKYLLTGEQSDLDTEDSIILNKLNKISGKDHARKLIKDNGNIIDWPNAKVVPGENGEKTVVAPIDILGRVEDPKNKFKPDAGWNVARIGAQAVLKGKDSEGNEYVLFVYKPRSSSFMELPGGGFGDNPGSNERFKQLLLSKLSYKCGIGEEVLTNLRDTGKALILNESGVALKDEIKWPWSYYRLFTAELKYPIDGDELSNLGYDNLSYKHVNASYNAYLRWVPVNKIRSNTAILNRYSTLLQHGII